MHAGAGGLGGVEVQFVKDGKTVSLNYSTVNIGVDDADKVEAADHAGRSRRARAASVDPAVTERSMALEITIDRELCMGSGNCSFWAPGVFDLDDEGIAIVARPERAAGGQGRARRAGLPDAGDRVVEDGEKLV